MVHWLYSTAGNRVAFVASETSFPQRVGSSGDLKTTRYGTAPTLALPTTFCCDGLTI